MTAGDNENDDNKYSQDKTTLAKPKLWSGCPGPLEREY